MTTEPGAAALPPYAELARDLPATSPRAWRYAALGAASRAGALVSDGLRTGHRRGFDSGEFMDHVYADAPSGRTALGRAVDRRLLSRRTCQAFRDIRVIAERAVLRAVDAHAGDSPPVVADMAAGPAPYLLRALCARPGVRAVLRDIDDATLAMAAGHARALGVADRVTTVRADAFDVASLAAGPRPDVVLELGLYGMFPDDALIARHIRELGELVRPAQVVCNVQTANPEIEYIARVWRDRHGGRCVWRLRPAATIIGWYADAGYVPAEVGADRHGIYRVMRMVRREDA
jgi:hypothetical protein